jgi:hypothetical protein
MRCLLRNHWGNASHARYHPLDGDRAHKRPSVHPEAFRVWSARLTAQPPYEWVRYFWQHSATAAFNARSVEIRDGALSFVSDESNVGEWIKHIDEWIAKTNRRYANELRAVRRNVVVKTSAYRTLVTQRDSSGRRAATILVLLAQP